MEEMNGHFTSDNSIDYTPEVVDIEGLQGMNSKQGMENFLDDMSSFNNLDTDYNLNQNQFNNPSSGYDYYPPNLGYSNMPNMNGTCAEVISCMAYLCYNASMQMMQMLQNGYGCNGMHQNPMQGYDCMNYTAYPQGYPQNYQQYDNPQNEEMHGYPPIM